MERGSKLEYEAPSVRDLGTLTEITGSSVAGHKSEGGAGDRTSQDGLRNPGAGPTSVAPTACAFPTWKGTHPATKTRSWCSVSE